MVGLGAAGPCSLVWGGASRTVQLGLDETTLVSSTRTTAVAVDAGTSPVAVVISFGVV